jgi:KUP system potassium uptake protein
MSSSPLTQRLAPLTLAALGVVYGDIGTSPLYAMKEIFNSPHHPVPLTPENILGILSLIFWSLTMVVTVKYVLFMLRADNKGEGGIMALMALALRPLSEQSRMRTPVLVLGLFGAALFYGDGVITPAISVLSAVEGLKVATPGLGGWVVPITLLILVALFSFQKHGSARVGAFFGPIMLLWFSVLAILGLLNLLRYPGVLVALNPFLGLEFLATHLLIGFFAMGAVVLVITGSETLYADMGHFGKKPVQTAWLGLVMPALALNYFGQGALLIASPQAAANPFYFLAPEWARLPLVVLATSAAVIASQAVITGAFSVTRQVIQLGYAPRMEVQHTSGEAIGQIYLPGINWALCLAVLALVLGFRSSDNMAAAYGIAVTTTMAIDSLLAFVVARWLWRWPLWKAILGALPFVLIDLTFFSATTVKIVDGGWFPLAFGLGIFSLLTTWSWGRRMLIKRLSMEALDLKTFVASVAEGGVTKVPGNAVFMSANPDIVPHALLHSLKHFKAIHAQVAVVTVKIDDIPHVPQAQRVSVEQLHSGFWRVRVHFGFMDVVDLPAALEWCAESGLELDMMDTSFFLGRETLIPQYKLPWIYWRKKLFAAMFRNASSAANYFRIPVNRVVELGAQIPL